MHRILQHRFCRLNPRDFQLHCVHAPRQPSGAAPQNQLYKHRGASYHPAAQRMSHARARFRFIEQPHIYNASRPKPEQQQQQQHHHPATSKQPVLSLLSPPPSPLSPLLPLSPCASTLLRCYPFSHKILPTNWCCWCACAATLRPNVSHELRQQIENNGIDDSRSLPCGMAKRCWYCHAEVIYIICTNV